jgi:hypothetical protein
VLYLALLAVVAVGYVVRVVLTRRARRDFCGDDGCLTIAVRMKPTNKATGWKHGYARLAGERIEWRGEHKLGAGADMTFDPASLVVREHRPVRKGETLLSDLCELVSARYQGEPVELGVLRTELDTFLGWLP